MERMEAQREDTLDRREFLKGAAAMLGAALVAGNAAEAASLLEKAANPEEAKEKEPKLSFEFFFSSHVTGADKRGVAEKVKGADVFVPEGVGWNEEARTLYQAVADGTTSPSEVAAQYGLREDPASGGERSFLATLRGIHNTKVRVEFLDPPQGDPLTDKMFEAQEKFGEIDLLNKDFPQLVEEFKERVREYSHIQVVREEYILKKLGALAADIRGGKRPELKGKQNVRFLLAFGAVHTMLSHELSGKGEDAKTSFERVPYIFGYESEMMRRFMLGKEVVDELATRAFAERIALPLIFGRLPGFESQPKIAFGRKVFGKFSQDELKGLFEKLRTEQFDLWRSPEIIKKELQAKGVEFPLTREELQKALQ